LFVRQSNAKIPKVAATEAGCDMPKSSLVACFLSIVALVQITGRDSKPVISGTNDEPTVKLQDARFYIFDGDELKQKVDALWHNNRDYDSNDELKKTVAARWDTREGKAYVFDLAQGIRSLFDLAQGAGIKHFEAANKVRLTTQGIMIIGRLPGDGTGPNRSFTTRFISPKAFTLKQNELLLVANIEFSGPFMDGEPKPQPVYFAAEVKDLPINKYHFTLKVEPKGEVYEKWKADKEIQLPKYEPMSVSFEIVDKVFRLGQ
jgi:hypothetical protein